MDSPSDAIFLVAEDGRILLENHIAIVLSKRKQRALDRAGQHLSETQTLTHGKSTTNSAGEP